MTRTALYRHYDADGALLYVGITDCLSGRDRQHKATSCWHNQVHRTETEWCLSRQHALDLEMVAIKHEAPKHNVRGSAGNALDRPHNALMSYVDHIVEVFGGVRPMAAAIEKQPSTVQSWKVRGSIPDEHKILIWEKAQERGLSLRAEHFVPFHSDNPTCGDAA